MLTTAKLKRLLHYNPATGVWTWRVSLGSRPAGGVAGGVYKNGYRYISVDGVVYLASRLSWKYMTGKWPKNQVDHKNRVKDDNRWRNLREATQSQNNQNKGLQKNNSSGVTGVCWHKSLSKWVAYTKLGGRQIYLGSFASFDAAVSRRRRAEKEHYGAFSPIKEGN